MPILTNVTNFEDKIVDAVRSVQQPVVDTVRMGVERAEGRLPKLRVPTLPRPTLPRVDLPRVDLRRPTLPRPDLSRLNLPRPDLSKPAALAESFAESLTGSPVVRSQVDFAKALLDTQRDFVGELADALSPLVATDEPKAAAKTKKSAPVTKAIAESPAKKTSPKRKSTRSSQTKD